MRDVGAEPDDLREDEEQHGEEEQRPQQRPEIAEDRAELGLLELGDGDQIEQLAEPLPAAAERGWSGHLPQLESLGLRVHAFVSGVGLVSGAGISSGRGPGSTPTSSSPGTDTIACPLTIPKTTKLRSFIAC